MRYDLLGHYYADNRRELVSFVAKQMNTESFAEDIVQDAFLRLMASKKNIVQVSLPSLVYTTMRKVRANERRAKLA